jgi:tRNA(Ile)-lysidine synthetase-like protein
MDKSCFLSVYNFWKASPQFWISIQNQKKADQEIYQRWFSILQPFKELSNTDFKSNEELIGYIIYLDQFQVHFDRSDKTKLTSNRQHCIQLLNEKDGQFWNDLLEDDLYFCLMPYKHLKYYQFCIQTVRDWTEKRKSPIKRFKILSRFYNDTYQKNFTLNVEQSDTVVLKSDFHDICEYLPEEYSHADWLTAFQMKVVKKELMNAILSLKERVMCVSLSGGVDSMVILYLAKQLGLNVSAIHIIYGNRNVSEQEFSFIQDYCSKLEVPLYYHRITDLKRADIERDFYEKMTREIRFAVYRQVMGEQPSACVVLGHILDDVVENIWTNFANCQHLDNLKKMEFEEEQMGVKLVRPFLKIKKTYVLECSHQFYIPYLKNTTPSWSNRGKFREHFYPSTHAQYGVSVDANVIKAAEILHHQSRMIEKLVYHPILETYRNQSMNITRAVEAEIEIGEWQYLIERFCHEKLNISKPSIHSVKEFVERLKRNNFEKNKCLKFQMKHSYQFIINKSGSEYMLSLFGELNDLK